MTSVSSLHTDGGQALGSQLEIRDPVQEREAELPEPDLEGGAREHLGTDEDDQPDEQTCGQDTRLPLVGHDPVGFRCHFPCTRFFLPRPDPRRSMSSQGLYQHNQPPDRKFPGFLRMPLALTPCVKK